MHWKFHLFLIQKTQRFSVTLSILRSAYSPLACCCPKHQVYVNSFVLNQLLSPPIPLSSLIGLASGHPWNSSYSVVPLKQSGRLAHEHSCVIGSAKPYACAASEMREEQEEEVLSPRKWGFGRRMRRKSQKKSFNTFWALSL